ncbi:hypothetical protein N7520_002960 [Penicillium odoratum]|uniref:uncharacterized protein n=1 Tax=Penicillium odoratum TaxID=1167516 RepID=UPI002548A63E|nr:uncharacterized protein N7520_002960 [Penicillium odoratum]KAJ5772431.1 hypothetical protein N7520_002960 [Penicillium odoratum]
MVYTTFHDMRYKSNPTNWNTRMRGPTRGLVSHVKAPGEPLPRATDDAPMQAQCITESLLPKAQDLSSSPEDFELFADPRNGPLLYFMVTIPGHSVSPVALGQFDPSVSPTV